MVKDQLLRDLKKAVKDLGYQANDIVCAIPPTPAFGDYSSNIALQLAKPEIKNGKQSPIDIANKIKGKLDKTNYLEKVEVAGGGFLNFFIKGEVLVKNLTQVTQIPKDEKPQKLMVEYGHANILKEVHLGHLRTFILGESLARILGGAGHKVFRANYQGDIGLHVAKAIWGIEKLGLPSKELNFEEKAEYLGKAYAQGSLDYEESSEAKQKINQINVSLYRKEPQFQELYKLGRKWSLEYYDEVYKILGIKYDKLFFESEVYSRGEQLVLENTGKIFEKSDGAVIFPGEKYGLHNRVFISSAGVPTYEAKDLGLSEKQFETFPFDRDIHVVGSEQEGYFKVVIKAIEMVLPKLSGREFHLSYGMVGLKEGKMSSRTGEVVTVNELLNMVAEKVREVVKESRLEVNREVVRSVAMGAIKFTYLKFAPSSNLVFDLQQSVSLQGDSGPYLQYTHARIRSVLREAGEGGSELRMENLELEVEERNLARRLEYFGSVAGQAGKEYRPNLICEYLLDLAKDFNLFYQKHRIIASEKKDLRLALTQATGEVLKTGLELLGIEAPERM